MTGFSKRFFGVRQHPIRILAYTTKSFWLLLIPLTRSLVALKFDLATWLRGRWLDVLVIALIFSYAFLRWVFMSFRFESDCIVARQGYFGLMESKIFYAQVTSIHAKQGVFYRAFRASRITVDTNSGSAKSSDLVLTVRNSDFRHLADIFNAENRDVMKYTYSSGSLYLLVFSLIFSSAFSGVVLFATFFYQAGRIVGQELEDRLLYRLSTAAERFAVHIPPIALGISVLISGGWFLSFLANVIRHWSFTSMRTGTNIVIESGILTRQATILSINKINYADMQQNMLTKLFRICSVIIHCAGYGKKRRQIAALIPITTIRHVPASLKMLLPGMRAVKISLKPGARRAASFFLPPLCAAAGVAAAGIAGAFFFPVWSEIIRFAGVILGIPLVWLSVVQLFSVFTTGVGFDDGFAVLSYCKLYKFHRVTVPTAKISKLTIRRTVFQKRAGTCSVKIYTVSETRNIHYIRQLRERELMKLLAENGFPVKSIADA
ncbi:MAG: PH domain-containing protein [Oscillospiraceae bacterium]